ncbi:MAG: tRNA (guanosine(37)-N1)-methyltransferase TrmD [Thermodesulfobacteriota bacterium]
MHDIRVLTIFPDIFGSFLRFGNPTRAIEAGLLTVSAVDIRDFAEGPHRSTDDYPYGGGTGMIMKPEPIVRAIRHVTGAMTNPRVILMTPQGRLFGQAVAEEIAALQETVLVCGRYEGVDERVRSFVHDEISVGDYVLSGGETAAMVIIDAVSRLIPGVLGADSHLDGESFYDGLLEYPQYTRPRVFEGLEVPQVLLEGNHAAIRDWRKKEALKRTLARRPDLLRNKTWDPEKEILLREKHDKPGTRTHGE